MMDIGLWRIAELDSEGEALDAGKGLAGIGHEWDCYRPEW